jgi:peptide methionine sulfoxide reductase MsrA
MPACNTHQTVALDIVRRPKTTPIHELERYMLSEQAHQHFTLKRDLTKAEASKLIDEMRKEAGVE